MSPILPTVVLILSSNCAYEYDYSANQYVYTCQLPADSNCKLETNPQTGKVTLKCRPQGDDSGKTEESKG